MTLEVNVCKVLNTSPYFCYIAKAGNVVWVQRVQEHKHRSLNTLRLVRTITFLQTDCAVYTQCFLSLLSTYNKKGNKLFVI